MVQHFRPALVLLVLFTILTGLVYPLAVTGVAQAVLPHQAGGSLVVKEGKVVGSSLIGQNFTDSRFFQPRPSATSTPDPKDPSKTVDAPYNAANSSGSNLGPTSKALIDRVSAAAQAKKDAGWTTPLPADALTTSASGLDPDVTPENALAQVPAVAKARRLDETKLRDLVAAQTQTRWIGLIGEPKVNVLSLNLALDALK
ncbi:MAG TPA: potassium-transporting ATPase subunit KdpC [Rhodoblastus sp.]|nr:potassium-transporting ATPase subunit KdpC [Rhodoblastus sp.]